jgi:serine/threonine protein kinase
MSGSIPSAPGRIFISYRRQDTAFPAGWLFDRLADHYGGGQVFKDVDSIESIELGDDFAELITRAVGSCEVLLALIGDRWLTITDEGGRRRLDDPHDFVRLEIEAALERNVRVIPVLVGGARMPRADELPDSLARLVRRQALELRPARFESDTRRLLKVLDETLGEVQSEQEPEERARRGGRQDEDSVEQREAMAAVPPVLVDRYEVGRLLGAGGMAEVFEGRDRLLARRVAIKVLRAQFARDPSFLIRFKREAQAAVGLSHPNIVGVYDTGTEDGTPFIVMEFVDGRTLKEVIRAGRLYPTRAAEIAAEICNGLAAAHARGLIHRDIKPGNVMLTPDGNVKVMDFGIARAGAMPGTAQCISPEQAQGQTVDSRSDLYSVGCCLYEMLTGRVPFTGESPVAIAYRHVREDPTPPRMLNPDVATLLGASLEAICLKAMAKLPDDRYQTAAEFHDDLERYGNDAASALNRSQAEAPSRRPRSPAEAPSRRPRSPAEPADLPVVAEASVAAERDFPLGDVSFTAAFPGLAAPEVWYSLCVYVYLGVLQAEVHGLIARRSPQLGPRPGFSTVPAFAPLRHGAQLRIIPEVQGMLFNPPAQDVTWLEDLQEVPFRVRARADMAGRVVSGAVDVHAGPLLVAQIPVSFRVRAAGEREQSVATAATTTARLFSTVFASYAHKDRRVVLAFAEAYRALGIKVLFDKESLYSGERWQEALLRLIQEADLFQLFWSKASSRSNAVATEWRHALSLQDRKGERFIRPLCWKARMPQPPAQLAHLHFASLDLAALSSVVSR